MTPVTEDFEYEQHFGSTEGLYVGEAGLRRWIETFYEIWDQASVKVESVRDAGDRIVSTGRTTVRGSLPRSRSSFAGQGSGGLLLTDAPVGWTRSTRMMPQRRRFAPSRSRGQVPVSGVRPRSAGASSVPVIV